MSVCTGGITEPFIEQLRQFGGRIFAPILRDIGFEAQSSESHLTSLLRSLCIENMCVAGDKVQFRAVKAAPLVCCGLTNRSVGRRLLVA